MLEPGRNQCIAIPGKPHYPDATRLGGGSNIAIVRLSRYVQAVRYSCKAVVAALSIAISPR
jgi:hypothetical protein